MSDRKKKYLKEASWLFGAVLIALFIAGRQLWLPAMPNGHDTLEYPARLSEFILNLQHGIFFPMWAPDFSNGYGQPFFMFNPPMCYYIASIFRGLGMSLAASWNAMALMTLLMMAVFMYRFAREYLLKRGAFLASVLYVLAPYTLAEIYVRCALAEYLAMAWLPLVFLGAKLAVEKKRPQDVLLTAVATLFVLLTHNPATLIIVPFLTLYVIFLSVQHKSLKGLVTAGLGGALGIGLSAYFFLPAFFQKNLIAVDTLRHDAQLKYVNHFWSASNWILPNWKLTDQIGVGLVHLVAFFCAVIAIILARKNRSIVALFLFFAFVTFASLAMSNQMTKFIWDKIPTLQYMQFPWRYYVFTAFGMAFLGGMSYRLLDKLGKDFSAVLFVAILAVAFAFPHAKSPSPVTIQDEYFSPESILENNLSATTRREYRPANAPVFPLKYDDLVFLQVPGRVTITHKTPAAIEATIQAMQDGTGFVRQFYFPGWTCLIDGKQVTLTREQHTTGMHFPIKAGSHSFRLTLEKTGVQKLGLWISVLSSIFCFGLLLFAFRKKAATLFL